MRVSQNRLRIVKVIMHILACLPLCALWWGINQGLYGAEPVERIIHFTGIGALNLLLITLSINPLAKNFKMGFLIKTRRLLGLYCFFYACLHIFSFFALDLLFSLPLFFEELIKRPYIYLGATASILLLFLAITSASFIRRKIGSRWQQLHNSIYLIGILVIIHFYWSVKSGWIEPAIYFLLLISLLLMRVKNCNFKY